MTHLATFVAFAFGCCVGQFITWLTNGEKFSVTTLALIIGGGMTTLFHWASNA